MANRLDVVAIRTNHKGCIVIRVVLRTQPGPTIVFASRLESSSVEVLDLPASVCGKGQMKMCRLLLDPANAQGRLAVRAAKLDAKRSLRGDGDTKRFESLDKE